jgi:molybdopterin-containing oxidoreductase family iron-sulfur binding subunit
MLVSVGAEFIESWGAPVPQIGDYTAMHAYRDGAKGKSVFVGSRQSLSCLMSDQWIRVAPGREAAALRVIIEGILESRGNAGASAALAAVPLAAAEEVIGDAAADLRRVGEELAHAGAPLVIATDQGADAETAHALAMLATHLAGGSGKTIVYPSNARTPRGSAIAEVQSQLARSPEVLLVHSANPAFLLPGGADVLDQAGTVVYFGTQHDETAERADLILPLHHSLETWGDHRASAGVLTLQQPTMRPVPNQKGLTDGTGEPLPLWNTRAFADVLLALAQTMGGELAARLAWDDAEAYQVSRMELHHGEFGGGEAFNVFLSNARGKGVLGAPVTSGDVTLSSSARIRAAGDVESTSSGDLLVHLFPHPHLYDGSGADKPLLQETPETTTAVVWGTWAEIHPQTAEEMGLTAADGVTLRRAGKEAIVPAVITPQVMPGVVAIPIGQGHTAMGRTAKGRGVNPLPLVTISNGGNLKLQGHAMACDPAPGEGRDLVRTTMFQDQGTRELARAVPINLVGEEYHSPNTPHFDTDERGRPATLYPEHTYPEHDWWMSIDLDACVGCGACSVACQQENNVPVVGADKVKRGREMSWLHIEKYVDDERPDDARLLVNLCQHCHHAPCEPVCPVHAAYHTTEGTNGQVYNRCVGTRYCSNNCTYKVRRFNWFDYTVPEPMNLAYNPDVTVRERGVMEKCTFCLQRTKEAKLQAKAEDREIADGEIKTACMQTCPAKAINFGDRKNASHSVNEARSDPRQYFLLEELGTRPSVTYLKKVLRGTLAEEVAAEMAPHMGHGGGHTGGHGESSGESGDAPHGAESTEQNIDEGAAAHHG